MQYHLVEILTHLLLQAVLQKCILWNFRLLIAECRSLMDEGLMTDILDEFGSCSAE